MIGAALLGLGAAGILVNFWADRLLQWRNNPSGTSRSEPDGGQTVDLGGARLRLQAPPEAPTETRPGAPLEVHLSLGRRCPARCTACYQDAGPEQPEVARDLMTELDQIAQLGAFEVAFGGGEVSLRPDLVALCAAARARGLVPNFTSSGFGISAELARALAPFVGQVNISLDGVAGISAEVRGWDGARLALVAIQHLVDAGVRVGVNTVLSQPLLATPGALEELGATLARVGVAEWQWLRFKPVGRGAAEDTRLAPEAKLLAQIWPRALQVEAQTGLRLRWDCALIPFLVDQGLEPELLGRLGLRGCPGGKDLLAIDAEGRASPCSFAAPERVESGIGATWAEAPGLSRWRASPPVGPCVACELQPICRGGCKVVSQHRLGDLFGPDPDCPRVIASEANHV